MSTYAKIAMTGATHGSPVLVAATAIGSGTTIHTAQSGTTGAVGDYVSLFASNIDTTPRVLTIGWGALSAHIVLTIDPNTGLVLVTPKMLLRNSLVVAASCDVTNKVYVFADIDTVT